MPRENNPAFGMRLKAPTLPPEQSGTRMLAVGPSNPDPRLEGLLRMVLNAPSRVVLTPSSFSVEGAAGNFIVRVGVEGDLHLVYDPINPNEPLLLLYAGCGLAADGAEKVTDAVGPRMSFKGGR